MEKKFIGLADVVSGYGIGKKIPIYEIYENGKLTKVIGYFDRKEIYYNIDAWKLDNSLIFEDYVRMASKYPSSGCLIMLIPFFGFLLALTFFVIV